jgi:phosphatidylethanolamine/phosphatidyl-N-methylethanolamine N-methyltransferase
MMGTLAFFLALVNDPRRVSAVAPSGRALANAITAEITPACGPVIELGPGTGVFTRALLARGVPEDKLALVEYGPDFARLLQSRFPKVHVLQMDAGRLKAVELFGGERVGAVVSGLPLRSMPARQIFAVLEGAFWHLRPGAHFYQFTYGLRCPVRRPLLDRLGLTAKRIGGALANMPPAAVYRITRQASNAAGTRA